MKEVDMIDLSWQLFEQTGEISYLMLYRALKDDVHKE